MGKMGYTCTSVLHMSERVLISGVLLVHDPMHVLLEAVALIIRVNFAVVLLVK